MMKNKRLFYGILVVILGIALLTTLNRLTIAQEINSFDDCAKAGYPILESYPRQCKTPDGRTFVEESVINADLDARFQLKINQIATIKSEKLEIKFLNITDSRCPSNARCVRAGEATILVNILNFGDFSLTSTAANEDLAVKNFDGYSIKLVEVDPYPKATKKIGALDYTATLVVSKV
jgi:hypothetical protein